MLNFQEEQQAKQKLIDFLDNNAYITPEEIKESLEAFHFKENNYNSLPNDIILKIIKLINKRTEEISNFLDVLNDKKLTEEEKKEMYSKNFPFRNSNYEAEKALIEKLYGTEEHQTFEDLIIDLMYDETQEPDKLKEQIRNIMIDNNIEIEQIKKHIR